MITRGKRRKTPATIALSIAIVLGFVVQIVNGALTDTVALAKLGAILPYDYVAFSGQYWRLVTAMFLHGGFLHLLLNLLALYQLGSLYEVMFGTRRFLLIYFIAGIGASITSMMRVQTLSVGASGAIFGILGAFVSSVLRSPVWRHERSARSLVVQCVFLIIANLAIGLQFEQIDNAAHIGGLVMGLLLGAVLPHRTPPPPPRSTIDVMPYEG